MAFEIAPPKRELSRASARRNDRDAIWRLCSWGGTAVVAVLALTAATQSGPGGKRLEQMFAGAPAPPAAVAQVAPRPPEKDAETLRLQAEVRSLAADRERLVSRLAKLEHHIEEVTGSIQRQAAAPVVPAPAAAPTAAPAAAVTPAPPPKIAAVRTALAATLAELAQAATAVPILNPLAMPAVTGSVGGWSDRHQEREDEPASAPPLETREVKVVPPSRLAALPAQEPLGQSARPPTGTTEYGIDLGTAPNMEALRARWTTIKANLGPLLTGLQPIAVRDRRPGNTHVHLVVGPMPNIAAARQVCTRFAAARVACQPAKFDGEAVVQR